MPATVLIIEDDELLRDIYATKFQIEGYTVETANDGVEGLTKANRREPNVILLDMIMPRMTGLEFLQAYRLASHHPSVTAIVISNKSSANDINEAKRMGARDYLIKSRYTPEQIAAHIRSYI